MHALKQRDEELSAIGHVIGVQLGAKGIRKRSTGRKTRPKLALFRPPAAGQILVTTCSSNTTNRIFTITKSTMANPTKLNVGISMLQDVRDGDFDAAHGTLAKVLGNIVGAPSELKFRKLRTTNPKIGALLATSGVRAVLKGAGFEEQGEFLVLPDEASADGAAAAVAALSAEAARRQEADAARVNEMCARMEKADKENEERKRMKMGIADDAAARKEPGWTAKAAGVKGGRDITGCADVGIGTNSGG